jgi:hypothetical protein
MIIQLYSIQLYSVIQIYSIQLYSVIQTYSIQLYSVCTSFVCLCVMYLHAGGKHFHQIFLNTVSKNLMLTAAHQTKIRGPWPMANAQSSELCIACCQLQQWRGYHSSLLPTAMSHLYKLSAGGRRSRWHALCQIPRWTKLSQSLLIQLCVSLQ